MSILRRLLAATIAPAACVAALAVSAPTAGAATPQMGPAGPVWVNGVLNYDSTNGQTMLRAINGYEQALEAVEQAAIPHNDWPITYVAVAPWVTALPSGVIGFKLTLGYENSAGRVIAFNQYEGQAFLDVHDMPVSSMGLPLFHAEAVLANAWAHWPA